MEATLRRKRTNAGVTAEQRRLREDEAPRLRDQIPAVEELTILIEETTRDGVGATTHKRRIVVDSAPALFEIACSDRDCIDGGFDITDQMMGALRSGKPIIEGEMTCSGTVADAPCSHTIQYTARAAYDSKAA
jgi:hypothetical protein